MASHSWSRVLSVLLLVACTPLGFWVYTDPVVTVSRVSLQLRRSIGSPVVVGLAVENRNDYALETERIEVALRLDGKPIGKLKRDSLPKVKLWPTRGRMSLVISHAPSSSGSVRARHTFAGEYGRS